MDSHILHIAGGGLSERVVNKARGRRKLNKGAENPKANNGKMSQHKKKTPPTLAKQQEKVENEKRRLQAKAERLEEKAQEQNIMKERIDTLTNEFPKAIENLQQFEEDFATKLSEYHATTQSNYQEIKAINKEMRQEV